MRLYGGDLLQSVAARILERHLRESGVAGVLRVDGKSDPALAGVTFVIDQLKPELLASVVSTKASLAMPSPMLPIVTV